MNFKSILLDVKEAIRYLWSPLLMLWIAFSLLILVSSCSTEDPVSNCGTSATIKDLRGLDGCTWVFELNNGQRLEPVFPEGCDTTNTGVNCSLAGVEIVDGKKVTIAWKERPDLVSVCMTGPIVEITCIEEVKSNASSTNL